MSQRLLSPSCHSILAAMVLLGGAALLAGCTAEAGPVTAASSEFRPAGEATEAAPAPNDVVDVNSTAKNMDVTTREFAAAHDPSTTPARSTANTKPAAPATPAPQGDVATLVAFIDKIATQEPQGATEQEIAADFVNIQVARLDAAKKVLALNPDVATKK